MRRIYLAILLFAAMISAQEIGIRVDEASMNIRSSDGKYVIELPIENTGGEVNATVDLEMLSPENVVVDKSSVNARIGPGRTTTEIPFERFSAIAEDSEALFWHRIRYRITPDSGMSPISGVVSMSRIFPDAFELTLLSRQMVENGKFRVTVLATRIATGEPVANVALNGVLEFNDSGIVSTSITDKEGAAVVEFQIPKLERYASGYLRITGKRGEIVRNITSSLNSRPESNNSIVTTDKPIYQPSQRSNFRIYSFDPNRKPVAGLQLQLKIIDPDGKTAFETNVTTSKFGIAHGSWEIPAGARLGDFDIEVSDDDQTVGEARFRVTRYDVPTFSVAAKTDRTFYLRDNPVAKLDIDATYVFGKPVRAGSVRIEGNRANSVDFDSVSGSLDESGKFSATVDLSRAFVNFDKEKDWQYRDLVFTAVVSDATTNRSETREIRIRVSNRSINVYVVRDHRDLSTHFPVELFVGAYYPDGTPATCEIAVYQRFDTVDGIKLEKSEIGEKFATVRTNKYGVGRIEFEPAPDVESDISVKIVATDADGRAGETDAELQRYESDAIRVRPDHVVYRPGQPIELSLRSNRQDIQAVVEIIKNGQALFTSAVRLQSGAASVYVPYHRDFNDLLLVSATVVEADRSFSDVATIIVPSNSNLKIEAETGRPEIRPGDNATLDIRVRDGDNKARESALGVLIIDRAVEDLARNEGERDNSFSRAAALRFPNAYAGLLDMELIAPDFTMSDLKKLDPSKPLDPDLELAIESHFRWFYDQLHIERSEKFTKRVEDAYAPFFRSLLSDVARTFTELEATPEKGDYPTTFEDLRSRLLDQGTDLDALRDPWGNQLLTGFRKDANFVHLEMWSIGPDETPDTADDLSVFRTSWPYFVWVGRKITQAFRDYSTRTGGVIVDYTTLRNEVLRLGFDLEKALDMYDNPYKFEFSVDRFNYRLSVRSAGPNGKFADDPTKQNDDVLVWSNRADYFSTTRANISLAFEQSIAKSGSFPVDESGFAAVLASNGFDPALERDVFGNPYYIDKIQSAGLASVYRLEGNKAIAVRQILLTFIIRSAGKDGIARNLDDFEMMRFTGVGGEETIGKPESKSFSIKMLREMIPPNGNGAVTGTIVDQNGAAIPDAEVIVTNESSRISTKTVSTVEGGFYVTNLSEGNYEIRANASGFKSTVVQNVRIGSSKLTEITITLEVGNVSTVVEVSAPTVAFMTDTTNSAISNSITQGKMVRLPGQRRESFTPRVRSSFKETLVWQPELVTAANGRAKIDFKMADNITSWSVYVVGNDEDGRFGYVAKDLRSFQPFFAELDPPRVLTEGDEISLPIPVRNYSDKTRSVDVAFTPNDWSTVIGQSRQKLEIDPEKSENALVRIRVERPITNGVARVDAVAGNDSDAIEKPVTVRPNNYEVMETTSDLVNEAGATEFEFSPQSLTERRRAEIKIYPDIASNIIESSTALLVRPHGCGEQTTSSTYPNLMLLKIEKEFGGKLDDNSRQTAKAFLLEGYTRILRYQNTSGFGYFEPNSPDAALTAYILRFLDDASDFIDVDDSRVNRAADWLLWAQKPNGAWSARSASDPLTTAYVLRSLVTTGRPDAKREAAVRKGLEFLKPLLAESNDPYLISSVAIAARAVGDSDTVKQVLVKLRILARPDRDGFVWPGNSTAFGGGGISATIESTALAANALLDSDEPEDRKLGRKGVLSLLRNRDSLGIWHSTQTTIVVLETLGKFGVTDNSAERGDLAVEIIVNGVKIPSVSVAENSLAVPTKIDIGKYLGNRNRVEFRLNRAAWISVTRVSYFTWDKIPKKRGNIDFDVKFDKTEGRPGEPINARIRVTQQIVSGGMMTAEIGLPPGSDVDRLSLGAAVKRDAIERYDVLPDRVVVYFWKPDLDFTFRFTPRFAMNAVSAPSVVYEYYNEESRSMIGPTRFRIE